MEHVNHQLEKSQILQKWKPKKTIQNPPEQTKSLQSIQIKHSHTMELKKDLA